MNQSDNLKQYMSSNIEFDHLWISVALILDTEKAKKILRNISGHVSSLCKGNYQVKKCENLPFARRKNNDESCGMAPHYNCCKLHKGNYEVLEMVYRIFGVIRVR